MVRGDYRLSGQASFPAQIHNVKTIVRWLRAHVSTYGLDPEHISVAGHSSGAHLAALLGTSAGIPDLEGDGGWAQYSSTVQAVVALSPPIDALDVPPDLPPGQNAWEELIGGAATDHPTLARMSNPMTFITPDSPPHLILHGTNDDTVPIRNADRLAQALRDAGVHMIYLPIEGGTHDIDTLVTREQETVIVNFLEKVE